MKELQLKILVFLGMILRALYSVLGIQKKALVRIENGTESSGVWTTNQTSFLS